MRRQLFWAVVAVASLVIGVTGIALAANPPAIIRTGNMVLALNAGVTPKVLPKTTFAPSGFYFSGRLSTLDGSHAPAISETSFDSDKDIVVDVKGMPSCRPADLAAQDTRHAKAVCGDAILGKGSATVEVGFPEQAPFLATGPLILF